MLSRVFAIGFSFVLALHFPSLSGIANGMVVVTMPEATLHASIRLPRFPSPSALRRDCSNISYIAAEATRLQLFCGSLQRTPHVEACASSPLCFSLPRAALAMNGGVGRPRSIGKIKIIHYEQTSKVSKGATVQQQQQRQQQKE